MSWIDSIQTQLTIITGDGNSYNPKWLNASFVRPYNVSEFEFIEKTGTFALRKKPKGTRYNLEIYFDGEEHLDVAKRFKASADDPRPWTLVHPFYGSLLVQPIELTYGNENLNVTKITGTIVETIADGAPPITIDPVDKIVSDKAALDEVTELSFVNDIPAPDPECINSLSQNISVLYEEGKKSVLTTLDAEKYFNLFNKANTFLVNATNFPLQAIRAIQAIINAPSLFIDNVKNRIKMLKSQFDLLRSSVTNILSFNNKKVYENNMAVLVSAMAQASVINYSYANGEEALDIAEIILDSYDQLIEDLDTLQSENGGEEGSFIPDAESITALSNLVSYTVSNLFVIALASKQKRSFYLEEDSNTILLAHRLLGLTPDDATIGEFIDINNIGLNEILEIKKDRLISYYV